MLPEDYRFILLNKTGELAEWSTDPTNEKAEVRFTPWKYSSGALLYGSEISSGQDGSADTADGAWQLLTAIDNGTNLFLGGHGELYCKTDKAVNGYLYLYMEHSTDGGTTWPSAETDFDPEVNATLVAALKMLDGTYNENRVSFEIAA